MADVKFDIPFLPQASQSEAVLSAIALANEQARTQQQLALQRGAQPSEIELRRAEASRYNAQTELDKMNMDPRRELKDALMGGAPGSAQPSTAQTAPAAPSQPLPNPKDFASPAEFFQAAVAARNAQPPTPAPAFKVGGLIGQTVNGLLADPSLKPEDRSALITAGSEAVFKAVMDPQNALDGIASTYNAILTRRGEMERAIKTEIVPDSQSSTGYSKVATRPDGSEAYGRHAVAPPVPKNLEEASAFLGSASLNYQRDPTSGNKSALNLAQVQHDAMYKDRLAEAAQQARATAQARGADYEAMLRTGKNPITGEVLSPNNAPPSALVNPTTGQVIPQDMISLYKPTENERQTADTARQVLAISKNLKEKIAKNPNLIGPLSGRSQQALQDLGFSSQTAAKLIDDVTFLQSAATKMHTGRFSSEILHKMGTIIKPGMGKDEFLGSLESIDDVATRYANEDKLTTVFEYQQRQQFENRGANAGALVVPAVAQKHGFQ